MLSTPSTSFFLHNVLHTPTLVTNLISVRQFTRDNNCSIEFGPHGFSVKDLSIEVVLMRCNSSSALYPISNAARIQTPHAFPVTTTSTHLCRQCLGHPGQHTLPSLSSIFSIPSSNNHVNKLVYDACQLGRHVRQPFANSNYKSSFPFQHIHCDLSTSPIASFTGFKYDIVILDDFTHYTWTYPLRNKFDVTSTLQMFYMLILS